MSISPEDQFYYKKRQSKFVLRLDDYEDKSLTSDDLRAIAQLLDKTPHSTLVCQYSEYDSTYRYEIHRWETKEEFFERLLDYKW